MYSWFVKLLFFLHSHPKIVLAYFGLKKHLYFEANSLVRTLQSTDILILNLFCSLRHEKKPPSNVEYLALKKIFITALAAQTAQTLKLMNSNVAYRPTVIKLGSQTTVSSLSGT